MTPMPTFLVGGDGNNFLRGNDHGNLIVGGAGRGVLIGGENFDLLFGGGEDDVLVGGGVANSKDELEAARSLWTLDDSFDARADNVRSIVRPTGPTGFDLLLGGAGMNLTLTPQTASAGAADDEPSALAAGGSLSGSQQNPRLAPAAHLLATIPSFIASNPIDPADINGDGFVTPLDAIAAINDINQHGTRSLFVFSDEATSAGMCNLAAVRTAAEFGSKCNVRGRENLFLDASLDDLISPLDTLLVVNAINAAATAGAANGEAEGCFLGGDDVLITETPRHGENGEAGMAELAVRADRTGILNAAAAKAATREPNIGGAIKTTDGDAAWDADLFDLLACDLGRRLP